MITGGTGALGSALVDRLMSREDVPERIVVYARGEHRHVEMAKKYGVNIRGDESPLRFFVGDVRDKSRLRRAMDGIDCVIHAAALKHVHVGEYNPGEFVQTNVYGTQNVVECAIDAGVGRVVGVSTDKACGPVNLYGATKLCAEKLMLAANAYAGGKARFSVCRYGNVSGSTGSVIPLWRELAEKGLTLTVTDPNMTRFWMTIEEAVDFVLFSLENAIGGEIFVPRLPAYTVGDLARVVADVYGNGSADLDIVGMRDGEKIHEAMISADESPWTHVADDLSHYVIAQGYWGHRSGYVFVPEGWGLSSDDPSLRMTTEQIAAGLP